MALQDISPVAPRSVQRVRHPLATRRLEVLNVLRISPHFVRVTLGGPQLEGFISASFDDHFKLMLPADSHSALVLPALGPDGPQWPADAARPVMRDFTPRFHDPVKRELDVEFALHGEGPASEWAAQAANGQSVGVGGPRGSFIIPVDYDWHLLIGDETALPAISRRLEELPRGAIAMTFVLTSDAADRRVFHTNASVTEQWVSSADELISALRQLELPAGEGFGWAAGEAKTIASVRQVLTGTHGMQKDHLRTAAYWKRGATAHHENLEGETIWKAETLLSSKAIFVQEFSLSGALYGAGSGLKVGVKDSIDIAGYATQLGSAVYADAPKAARHADVVQAVLDAGCEIVGKTTMHELAYGVTGINGWSGTPVNPRHPDRVPGGSSSGSAVAVAANRVDFALGTDTGGSIRIPATSCGVVGLKTTYGRVSREGVHPRTSSLDCVGPFARELSMIERAMALIDSTFVVQKPPASVRLGMVTVAAEPGIDLAVRQALDRAGIPTQRVTLPSFDAVFSAGLTIIGAENWATYGPIAESAKLGGDVRTRLLAARDITPEALRAAEACRLQFRAEVDALFQNVDALVLPTLPDVPLALAAAGDAAAAIRTTRFVRPFNVSGHPALSLPLLTSAGLPAGLQLVGPRGADAALCAIAHAIVG